jgi:hypothetical protein
MWGCAVTFHDDRSQNALKRVIGENLEIGFTEPRGYLRIGTFVGMFGEEL